MTYEWISEPCQTPDKAAEDRAIARQQSLTKPPGSLGQLEDIAISFAGWQGLTSPTLENILVRVFAADHGFCQHGVSAFPQAVTQQMILNFINGGAAISVLARDLCADFSVINVGTVTPTPDAANLVNAQLAPGTADFTIAAAMSDSELSAALALGRQQVLNCQTQLFIGGEMGIGNTTSASALYSHLLGLSPGETVGPGTGVANEALAKKRQVVGMALSQHAKSMPTPEQVLRHLGGLEIAALTGAYIAAAQEGIPSLVDGFICTAAALVAVRINPGVRDWLMFAHQSAEPAHIAVLQALNAQPILNVGMRLGEGSGAAVAVNIVKSALLLHQQMATFSEAGVSNRD